MQNVSFEVPCISHQQYSSTIMVYHLCLKSPHLCIANLGGMCLQRATAVKLGIGETTLLPVYEAKLG